MQLNKISQFDFKCSPILFHAEEKVHFKETKDRVYDVEDEEHLVEEWEFLHLDQFESNEEGDCDPEVAPSLTRNDKRAEDTHRD